VLYLLYRSGGGIPRFTGTSHTWTDGRAILSAVPESARKTGLGGVGYLVDTLSQDSRNRHTTSKVRMDGWHRYRIEPAGPPDSPRSSPAGKRPDPSVTGCDGSRYWEAHEDRVGVGRPLPAPANLADLADTSWMLGCELSGDEPVTSGSRAAYRLSVRGGPAQSPLLLPGCPAVAVVDAETGRLIRLTCYADGKPARRYELRDVIPAPEGASDDTGYAVPQGLPVVDVTSDPLPPDPSRVARGARDSRKQATREALREAAMRLALEHGPGNVPDAYIAAAVGVPLRVYDSCFSSAEQAIVAAVADAQRSRLVSAVVGQPPQVPLRRAVTDAIMEAYASPAVRHSKELQLILAHPALRYEYLNTAGLIEDELSAVIAERIGIDRREATWPSKSIAGLVRSAIRQWLESVDLSASADEFPTRPLVWRLRLALKMSGGTLDIVEARSPRTSGQGST
jgi:AcrR family transcriptional regulator